MTARSLTATIAMAPDNEMLSGLDLIRLAERAQADAKARRERDARRRSKGPITRTRVALDADFYSSVR